MYDTMIFHLINSVINRAAYDGPWPFGHQATRELDIGDTGSNVTIADGQPSWGSR